MSQKLFLHVLHPHVSVLEALRDVAGLLYVERSQVISSFADDTDKYVRR
jgi:hypothetical protein